MVSMRIAVVFCKTLPSRVTLYLFYENPAIELLSHLTADLATDSRQRMFPLPYNRKESKASGRLLDIFRGKVDHFSDGEERQIFESMEASRQRSRWKWKFYGTLTFCITLGGLRCGRHVARRRWNQLKNAGTNMTTSPFEHHRHNTNNNKTFSPSTLLGWWADTVLAWAMGIVVARWVILDETHRMVEQISKVPLLPDRSRVAETVCPDFVKEVQCMQQEEDNVLEDPKFPHLVALLEFGKNCQRRARYERRLRRQRGLKDSDAVPIPPPGVPIDDDLY